MKKPSPALSLSPFVLLSVLMILVVWHFGADALNGGSQVALILSAGFVIAVSMIFCKTPFKRIEEAIGENIHNIAPAIIILLLIGAIGGTWMLSGVVPTLIVYGLKIISPGIYLFAAALLSAVVALMTGSSWTTIATLGVALIAIGQALGFEAPLCAGAIISGAYFGDKVSPLSDTTVLASSSSGVPLFTHIRYMMISTAPAFVIALLIYLVISLLHPSVGDAGVEEVEQAMRSTFNISGWLLVVPVITGIMIWRKVPAILTLLSASLMACVAALIAQPRIVAEVAGSASGLDFNSAFKGITLMLSDSTSVQTGSEAIDSLVATGGMKGMLLTIFLIICAAMFGGSLVGSGMIDSLTDALTRRIRSRGGLVGATLVTGLFSNIAMGDQYLSIILTTRLYKELYARLGYEDRLLSRSTEDCATVTSVLIPWNSCGMTQATVLRVPTLSYAPFCFFNILSPVISAIYAVTGYKIYRRQDSPSVTEGR